MFCTGGIRCEKASSHLLQNGFTEVYHLKGGILNYLENVEPEDSLWKGECFVFDHRVSVVHGLKDGDSKICFGCRWPLRLKTWNLRNTNLEFAAPTVQILWTRSGGQACRKEIAKFKSPAKKRPIISDKISHFSQKIKNGGESSPL